MARPSEDEHLEFKEAKQQIDSDALCEYCIALANECGGRLLLGITNRIPRRVVGTSALQNTASARRTIFERTRLRVDIDELAHPDGRVVCVTAPSRPLGLPLEYRGRYLMRAGESIVSMTQEQLQRIFAEAQGDYTAETVVGDLQDLDTQAVEEFRRRWARRTNSTRIQQLSPDQLLVDAGLLRDEGQLTRGSIILLGTKAAVTRLLPSAEIVFEYRSSRTSIAAQQRMEFRQGFFGFYQDLWQAINARNDQQSFQDGLFRIDVPTFEESVVREALLNAVCHRDYRLGGSIFVKQSPRELTIISPGGFPAGVTVENVLDRQMPRNRQLAEAFALCGLVERSGQGMNRIFEESLKHSKRIPDFSGTDAFQVAITLHGKVEDPAFVRFLEKLSQERVEGFAVTDLLVLNHVFRQERIPHDLKNSLDRLLELGVVEKYGRKVIMSRALYSAMGIPGVYTRRRGLDHETNKALLVAHLQGAGSKGSPLSELVQVLPHIGEKRVQRLLHELRAEGRVAVRGQRRWARWLFRTAS
jgi:ATP-dependent DNA helicase RecG